MDRIAILKILVTGALKKAIPFVGLAIVIIENASTEQYIRGLVSGLSISLLLEYRYFVHPNLAHHKKLSRLLGEKYDEILQAKLKETTLENLFSDFWFVKEYKKTWDV